MNTRASYISCTTQADGSIDITVPASMAEDFKLLVKRGTNTYPSKHVEIMDFADRLNGLDCAGTCMKQELYGYPLYAKPQQQAVIVTASPAKIAEAVKSTKDILESHWDIPAEDKMMIAEAKQEQKSQVIVGKSLLSNSSDQLPEGCYCKPGKCAAPKPEWCRDADKRDAKKD